MNSEDFFAFAYPAFAILGVLLSGIPAYIASKKNKSFWLWWISTAAVFMILLLVVIKNQAISLLIYLLAIMPLVSILALLPGISSGKFFSFLFMFILTGVLYYYVVPKDWWKYSQLMPYSVALALVFLMACLGYIAFLFIFSKSRKENVFKGLLLTFLLSTPVLRNPSYLFSVLRFRTLIYSKMDLGGAVIAELISKPVGGIFILLGICSALATALILLNDKYGIVKAAVYFVKIIVNMIVSIFQSDDYSPPYIHFSKIPASPILVLYLLYVIFFIYFFHPTEGWIFLIPLVWLCLVLPMFLLSLAGTILSTIVIGASINQKKNLYALGIFLCGFFACWKGLSLRLYRDFFGKPGVLLMFYGATTGLIALILWAISDSRGPREIDGFKS